MTEQMFQIINSGQGVKEPDVPPIHLGRFDKPLSCISAPRRNAADKIESFEQIEVVSNCFAIDFQGTGHWAQIQCVSLLMSHHGAQTTQKQRSCGDSELRQISLDIADDKILTPMAGGRVVRSQKAFGLATANPLAIHLLVSNFKFNQIERTKLQVADSTGERLGTLSEKLWRCGPEDQKLPEGFASAAPLIQQALKHWKQVRQALNLIKDDQMVCKLAKIKFRVCQFGDVGRALQIEIMNRLSKPRASVV
jgi:hypothetical protein